MMRRRYGRIVCGTGCAVALLALAPTVAGAAADGAAKVTTVAGTGVPGGAGGGGPSSRAELAAPSGIAVDRAGDVAVADSGNCRVELIAGHSGRHFGIAMKARDMYAVAGTGCGRHGSRAPSPSVEDP